MKRIGLKWMWGVLAVLPLLMAYSGRRAANETGSGDPLPSWNETGVKKQLLEYVALAKERIPEEDRIAVFDMDGTIACESPLWFEMAVAVQGMVDQLERNPELIQQKVYQYARSLAANPADTSVLNHWVVDGINYLDSLVLKAFDQTPSERYIAFARNFLETTPAPRYDRVYGKLFYQPMLELIAYLQEADFKVYIVSGSLQGLVWSICPQTIGVGRDQLIGTRQQMTPVYPADSQAEFILQKATYPPKNDGNGKSVNIYQRIGKIPVFAFGNTAGDFGMFHLASTSPYPHIALLLNHDDGAREYVYESYHGTPVPAWRDSMRLNNWVTVDMSSAFKEVWMK